MPLGDRRALTVDHLVPVSRFVVTRRLSAHDDPSYQFVFAVRIVVPDADDEAAGGQLVGGDVEVDRLVEDGVDGVALRARLL